MSPAMSQASQSNHSREISISFIPERFCVALNITYVSHIEPGPATKLFQPVDEAINVFMQGRLLLL